MNKIWDIIFVLLFIGMIAMCSRSYTNGSITVTTITVPSTTDCVLNSDYVKMTAQEGKYVKHLKVLVETHICPNCEQAVKQRDHGEIIQCENCGLFQMVNKNLLCVWFK